MLYHMFNRIALFLKHPVLEWAHPLPWSVEVHVRGVDSLESWVIDEVIYNCGTKPIRKVTRTLCLECPVGVSVNNDPYICFGTLSACRYLGRLSRFYPTTPESALLVDSSLELLKEFITLLHQWNVQTVDDVGMACLRAHVSKYSNILESRFQDCGVWMEGMDSKSLADVCWMGAFRWIFENDLMVEEGLQSFPQLAEWWEMMSGIFLPEDGGEGDNKGSDEDDDKGSDEDDDKKNI